MNTYTLTVSELKKIIKESANEFKAVIGKNVDKTNKENNNKSYKDIETNIKNYDGGLRDNSKSEKKQVLVNNDDNRGMESIRYDGGSASKEFKERIKSQMKGYISPEDEKKHKDERSDYSLDGVNEKQKEIAKGLQQAKTSGIQSNNNKDTILKNKKESVFENKNMKQLLFKKTVFVNENHITSKIPDDFKKEGNKFIIKDKADNEFLIEWSCNKANIINYMNNKKLNEELERIKTLFNYDSTKFFGKNHIRKVNEDQEFNNILENSRLC